MPAATTSDPRLAGEWTVVRAAELRGALLALLEEQRGRKKPLALDLSEVTAMDSAGFQLLVALLKSAQAAGLTLRLSNPSAAVTAVADVYHWVPAELAR